MFIIIVVVEVVIIVIFIIDIALQVSALQAIKHGHGNINYSFIHHPASNVDLPHCFKKLIL